MARYIRSINGYNDPIAETWRVAANQTINEGDLVQLNATSKYLEPAVAASTALVGIANESITTGATVTAKDAISITPLSDIVVRISYTGATKTSLTDADLHTLFDLSDATTIDLDAATGMCAVVGYNNTNKTADVIMAADNVARV